MTDDLEAKIAHEKAEIDNAPKIPIHHLQPTMQGRCSFCGQLAANLTLVEVFHGAERFRGECCGGNS